MQINKVAIISIYIAAGDIIYFFSYYFRGRRLVERALTHVVLKAVLGGFLAQDPANTKYIACIVDVSYEWNFLSGPCRRLGVSLDF